MAASDNTVQFVIEAKDKAQDVLKSINTAVTGLGSSSALSQAKIAALGATIVALGGTGLSAITGIGNAISGVQNALRTPVGATVLDSISKLSEDALGEIQPLSEALREIVKISSSFNAGFVSSAKNSAADVFKLQTDIYQLEKERVKAQSDGDRERLRSLNNQIAKQKEALESTKAGTREATPTSVVDTIDEKFKASAEKLTENLGTALKKLPVTSFLKDKFGFDAGGFVSSVDKAVANSLLGKVVNTVIPKALGDTVNRVFGTDLTETIKNTIATSGLASVLPDSAKKLAQGTVIGALESAVSTTVASGFKSAFSQINGIAESYASQQGKNFALKLLGLDDRSSIELFNKFDVLTGKIASTFGGRLSEAFPKTFEKFGGLQEVLKRAAPDAAQTNIGGNLIKQLDTELGPKIADKLRAIATGPLGDFLKNIGGNTIKNIFSGIDANIPSQLKTLFGIVQESFPDEIKKLQKTAEADIQRIAEGLAGPIQEPLLALADKFSESFSTGFNSIITGEGKFVESFKKIDDFLGNALTQGFSEVGANASTAFGRGFANQIYEAIAPAINRVDEFIIQTVQKIEKIPSRFTQTFGTLSGGFTYLAGLAEPVELLDKLSLGAQTAVGAIFQVSEKLTFLSFGLQALKDLVLGGPFDLLIGQNVRLQEQLLSTQASLAATNKVVVQGQQIKDPYSAIQALQAPVAQAIKELRKGSLELVGVTSSELVPLFQIVAQEASLIGASLEDTTKLSLSFAASLGTLQIPLAQARQEIVSLLQGQITMDSQLAKSLGITNAQVNLWKTQGRLVQEVLARLEAFRAGNKLAAETVSGYASNIQEIVEEIGRISGQKFLAPIVAQMGELYRYLLANQNALADIVSGLADNLFDIATSAVNIVRSTFDSFLKLFGQVPAYLLKSLTYSVQAFAFAIQNTVNILQPFVKFFSFIAQAAGPLGGVLLFLAIQFKVLQGGIALVAGAFEFLLKVIPGTGELLFLLQGRMLPLVNLFPALASQIGTGAAGFLLLGKHMNAIPGAAGLVTQQLTRMLGGMAPLANFLTTLIPGFAGFAIQVVGLTRAFPPLQGVFTNLIGASPKVLQSLAGLARQSEIFASLAPSIEGAAKQLSLYTRGASSSALITEKFSGALRGAGFALKQFLVSTALLGAGLFAAFVVFDELVLKNEGLKKAFAALADVIRGFARAIGNILGTIAEFIGNVFGPLFSNPITKAITIIGLLVAALSLLAPAVLTTTKAFFTLTSLKIVDWVTNLGEGIKNLIGLFDSFALRATKAAEATSAVVESTKRITNPRIEALEKQKKQLLGTGDTAGAALIGLDIDFETQKEVEGQELDRQRVKENAKRIKQLKQQRKAAGRLGYVNNPDLIQLNKDISEAEDFIQQKNLAKAPKITAPEPSKSGIEDPERISQRFKRAREAVVKTLTEPIKLPKSPFDLGDFDISPLENVKSTKPFDFLNKESKSVEKNLGNTKSSVTGLFKGIGDIGKNASDFTKNFKDIGEVADGAKKVFSNFANVLDVGLGKGLTLAGKGIVALAGSIKVFALETLVSLGPTLALIGTIYAVTQAFEIYNEEAERTTKVSKALAESVADAQAKIDISRKISGQSASEALKQLDEDRKKLISSGKSDDDPAIKAIDAQIAKQKELVAASANTNKNLEANRKKEISENRNFLSKIFLGVADTVASIFTLGTKNYAASDIFTQIAFGKDKEGFNKGLDESEARLKTFRETTFKESQQYETDLVQLTNKRAEASTKNDDAEVARLDRRIEGTKVEIANRKQLIDDAISGLEKQKPLDEQTQKRQAETIKHYKDMRDELEKLGKVTITPIDLPYLGSTLSQLEQKAKRAYDVVSKTVGNVEEFTREAKELLDAVPQQLKLGEIDPEEARNRLGALASNANAEAATQIQAQEGITNTFKVELDRRTQDLDVQQEEVKTKIASGVLTELEGAKEITHLKQEQLKSQLKNLVDSKTQQDEVLTSKRKKELDQINIEAEEAKRNKTLGSLNQKDYDDKIIDINERRKKINETYNKSLKESDRNFALEEQKLQEQSRQNQLEGEKNDRSIQLKNNQDFLDRRLQNLKSSESRRLQFISQQENVGKVTTIDALKSRLESQERVQKQELANEIANQAKLQEVLASTPKASEEERRSLEKQIRDSNAKIDELNQQLLDFAYNKEKQIREQRAKDFENLQKETLDLTRITETQRNVEIARFENAGQLTKAEADRLRVVSTRETIDFELKEEEKKQAFLKNELKNAKNLRQADRIDLESQLRASNQRVADLTKQSLESEQKAFEAYINLLTEKLNNQSKAFELGVAAQNQELTKQQQLIEAIGRGLENRNKLNEASKALAASANDLLVTGVEILAKGAKSEKEKARLAQVAAALKLEATLKSLEYERQSLKIQQEQTRLAQVRKEIENAIAIAKSKVEIEKGKDALQIAQAELAQKPEDPAAQLKVREAQLNLKGALLTQEGLLQERGLLQEDKAQQGKLFAIQNKDLANRQQRTVLQATSELVEATPGKGAKRQLQEQLGDYIQQTLGIDKNSLLSGSQDIAQRAFQGLYTNQSANAGQTGLMREQFRVEGIGDLSNSVDDILASVDKIAGNVLSTEAVRDPNLVKPYNKDDNYASTKKAIQDARVPGETSTTSAPVQPGEKPLLYDTSKGINKEEALAILSGGQGYSPQQALQALSAGQQGYTKQQALDALRGMPVAYTPTDAGQLYTDLRGQVPGLSLGRQLLKLTVDRASIDAAKSELSDAAKPTNTAQDTTVAQQTQTKTGGDINISAPISVTVQGGPNASDTGKQIGESAASYLDKMLNQALAIAR